MIISRRAVLITSAIAAVAPLELAAAQVNAPPSVDVVTKLLEDPKLFSRILIEVGALRSLLVLVLLEMEKPSKNPGEDFKKYMKVTAPFRNPDTGKILLTKVSTAERKKFVEAAGKSAMPTAKNIEGTLAKYGVSPKGQIGMSLLSGFYELSQVRALADKKIVSAKESWYCSIYPFSYFCSAG